MKRNIDIMSDDRLEAYFEMVYQKLQVNTEILYEYDLAARTEWRDWYHKRLVKLEEERVANESSSKPGK